MENKQNYNQDTPENFNYADHNKDEEVDSLAVELIDFQLAEHETQESEGGEADLHKYLIGCNKNPGHLNFIPVDTFSLKDIPQGLQDNDLYEYIKVVADLTVKVDVKMTSPDRPEFWPGTKKPYPFYNLRGKSTLKTGTGMVRHVEKYTDGMINVYESKHWDGCTKCWCTECNNSGHACSVWWEFKVHTATHVVFDGIEANYTSLRLFYDRNDSPNNIMKVINNKKHYVNTEHDSCKLRCVTCDEDIGVKLGRSWALYYKLRAKVRDKFKRSRDIHRMTFIVSHPHGCSKQVSIGQWKDMYQMDGSRKKCTYTTCTCPGSSGAQIFCVGFYTGLLSGDLVHSGAYESRLNCSSIGWL